MLVYRIMRIFYVGFIEVTRVPMFRWIWTRNEKFITPQLCKCRGKSRTNKWSETRARENEEGEENGGDRARENICKCMPIHRLSRFGFSIENNTDDYWLLMHMDASFFFSSFIWRWACEITCALFYAFSFGPQMRAQTHALYHTSIISMNKRDGHTSFRPKMSGKKVIIEAFWPTTGFVLHVHIMRMINFVQETDFHVKYNSCVVTVSVLRSIFFSLIRPM